MKAWLERRWYAPLPPPLPLRPLAALYGALAAARARRLRAAAVRVAVPVIVVGNISVGGTGKTPFTIWLVERLREWGWRPGVVSRGYGGHAPHYPQRVAPDGDPRLSGDEPLLIAQRCGCPVVVDPDRVAAARALLADGTVDIIVSDDGLQHYRLGRDLEICLVDGRRGLGNGALLPAGPLREPAARLAGIDLLVVNGDGWQAAGALRMQLRAGALRRLVDGERRALADFRGAAVHAVAGIGDPSRFFASLVAAGLRLREHPFADHHAFTATDLAFGDDRPVIMTEKDAVKCRAFADARLWAAPVDAQLDEVATARVRQCIERLRAAQARRNDG
ncbi:tetraacyldisaccharide 4'-kinase [Solimonas flava]|uniref:tetraacyldisaccharide 4'-kinase n=1 Tax=Solimonas flava TaxID=415849 RepID=UPI0003FBAFF6|nr:tetraacyldisaccharide 4'-kinase [Solimonas flava]